MRIPKSATNPAREKRDSGNKHDRLLHLLVLLQGGPPRTAEALAAALGVSKRSLFRYLRALDRCEVPYFHDEAANGYRIRESFFLQPPNLTAEEALALAHACGVGRNGRNGSIDGAVASAWSKIESVLPSRVRAIVHERIGDNILSLDK
mgnify:CR=1 FL=1